MMMRRRRRKRRRTMVCVFIALLRFLLRLTTLIHRSAAEPGKESETL
jgi:hypothetical protein